MMTAEEIRTLNAKQSIREHAAALHELVTEYRELPIGVYADYCDDIVLTADGLENLLATLAQLR